MKLSEAILLGSVGSTQGFGSEAICTYSEKKCALGAALLAVGVPCTEDAEAFRKVADVWPWVDRVVPYPDGLLLHNNKGKKGQVWDVIWQLNDIHKWTRPQIAQWVSELEQTQEAQVEAVSEVAHVGQ